MGNEVSSPQDAAGSPAATMQQQERLTAVAADGTIRDKSKFKSFPGSAILEKTFCGSIDTTDPSEYEDQNIANRLLKKADIMCVSSPGDELADQDFEDGIPSKGPVHPSSAMLARALVSEVTDNPKTMKPAEMAAREKKLLRAQQAANKSSGNANSSRPIGAPGPGVGPPHVLSSFAYACTGDENVAVGPCVTENPILSDTMPPGPLQENRAMNTSHEHAGLFDGLDDITKSKSPYLVTIGLSLSRRYEETGHADTVTRQTAFDFNELQDRSYKYVASTDKHGWRAGGGESGQPVGTSEETAAMPPKVAAPDVVHIPIIHIDCPNAETVDQVIHALANGEIFIPHMTVLPESLSVQGISPPDLVVRFGCERNEDVPPEEWPNWCLEFMHNQLYEYFYHAGARWRKRPFSITLARKVRWKTVKHMNRYFAHAERVTGQWRERGPQTLDPQLSYVTGGATPEEVSRPHGIYLFRNGVPTNYFGPNIDPPYTTKLTRSLLQNVLDKSWDRKRREWSCEPMPRLLSPSALVQVALGCGSSGQGGFVATEVTTKRPILPQQQVESKQALASSEQAPRKAAPQVEEQVIKKKKDKKQQQVYADPVETGSAPALQEEAADHKEDDKDENKQDRVQEEEEEEEPKKEPEKQEFVAMPDTSSPVVEEKKTDEPSETSHSHAYQKSVSNMSAAASVAAPSVAASGTTVMHANKTVAAAAEEWVDDTKQEKAKVDPPPEETTTTTQEALELERQRQDELMEQVQKETTKSPKKETPRKSARSLVLAQALMDREKAKTGTTTTSSSNYTMKAVVSTKATPKKSPRMDRKDSMEYSTDGSAAFNDGATYFSEASAATSRNEDEGLLIQESTSSVQSAVPSDEDLFALGWAKALDASSGNYYYFTLDRTRTVWENPLSTK